MKQTIKSILAFAAALLCGGAWAAATPKLLINFAFNATPEVTGWHRHYQNGGGKLGGDGITENGITFSTTSGGNFYERAKVSGDYQTGTYVGIDGTTEYTSVTNEIAGSLGFGESIAFTDDVWKTGLMNGGVSGHEATISGLSSSKKYVVYLGYGLYKSDGPSQQPGFEYISDGYSSVESIQYVKNTDSSYQNYTSGQIKPDGSGLMVVRVKDLVPTASGEFKFKLVGDRAGMNFLVVGELEGADSTTIERDDVFTATAAEALDSADVYNLTIPENGTFTVDADLTRSYNLISDGTITLTGANLTTANLAKLVNQTEGYIYRIESDLSAGTTPGFGEGTYSYKNAKITNAPSQAYKFVVKDGDALNLAASQVLASLEVQGGAVTIGDVNGSSSFWYGGKNATTYNQTGGTVTSTATGTGTSGSGNGLLLSWSQQMASMTVSGGTLQVPNSSLNFWDGSLTLNVSGGTVKAKGVFKGNSSGHKVVLSDTGTFELGSIGWTGVDLTLNGGTFKAYENTTMASPITMGGAANIEVSSGVELKLTGSVTGSGVITKKGDGVLNVGSARPTINVVEGSVKIVATSAEITAGQLVLPIPEDAAEGSLDKVSVVTAEGNTIEINGAPIVDDVNHTITINLVTIPAITDTKSISELGLSEDKTGTLVIQGAATAEDAYTVTFDVALPAGVDVTVNGHVVLEGANVPNDRLTIEAGTNLTIPTFTGTVASGVTITTASATGTITNNGTLNVTGNSTYTLTNNGTLNINGGVSTITSNGQSVMGTVNIAYGATYKCTNNDQVPYGGSTTTTINVRGTLDMQNHRWTLGGADTINLYGGCTVSGQGDSDGLFDLYRSGNIINVNAGEGDQASVTTIEIPAPIRARNTNGNIFIAEGMKLALTGGIKDADTANSVINMNGNGRLTDTIPLKGGFTLNLGNAVGTIDAKFVAENGTTVLKWTGDGSTHICNTDSKAEPFITVNPTATLKIYGKDFSGWNGALTDHGWIQNNGTLVFADGNGSRFWREHVIFGDGSTMCIDHGGRALLLYGGAGAAEACQFMLPSGTATIKAGEGDQAGDKAVLYFGNDGDGGWGDNDTAKKATGFFVGDGATLTVSAPIKGDQAVAKYGEGELVFSSSDSTYSGTITLNEGVIKSKVAFGENKVVSGNANMKVVVSAVDADGYTTYSLAQRDATTVYATANNCSAVALANGTAVTLIDGDAIVLDSDHITGNDVWGLNVTSVSSHDVTLSFNEANLKGGVPANMNLAITKGRIYLYSDIGAGATITGEGAIELTRNASGNATAGSIGNGASIGCSVGILSGSTITINGEVEITGTITCDGAFKLADGATLTCAQLAEGKVTTDVEGKKVVYADGAYKLADAVTPLKPGETSEPQQTAPTADELARYTPTPVNDAAAAAGQAAILKVVSKETAEGWVITVDLDETKMPEGKKVEDTAVAFAVAGLDQIACSTVGQEIAVPATAVTPGAYYSVIYGDSPTALSNEGVRALATSAGVTITVPAMTGKKAQFFRVKASAQPTAN